MDRQRKTIDTAQLRIDEIADNFESMWRQQQSPCIRDFVAASPLIDDPRLLIELIKIDLEYRAKTKSELPSFRELVDLYPELIEARKDDFDSLITTWKSMQPQDPVSPAINDRLPLDSQAIPPDADPVTPSFIGRFQVDRKLGTGGFGEVFLALDREINRHVAIKIPRKRVFTSSSERTRFLAEARAIGSLKHPNIIGVH